MAVCCWGLSFFFFFGPLDDDIKASSYIAPGEGDLIFATIDDVGSAGDTLGS